LITFIKNYKNYILFREHMLMHNFKTADPYEASAVFLP
jgi:hypothetical protein